MLKKFLKSGNNIYSRTKSFIINLPNLCQKQYNQLVVDAKEMILKFNNLRNTNIELVKHHLSEGRMFDAKLRLGILSRIIAKEDEEIFNLKGWTYYIDGNIEKSIESFSLANNIKIVDFLSNPGNYEIIPQEIYKTRRSWQAHYYDSLFLEGRNYLPRSIIKSFAQFIPQRESKKILDLGAATGIIAYEFENKNNQDQFFAIENSQIMINYINKFHKNLYKEIFQQEIIDFLKNNQEKFDIILSFCSLDFIQDLGEIFKNSYKSLNDGGVFCLALQVTTDKTQLNNKLYNFVYNVDEIIKILKDIGYYVFKKEISQIRDQEYVTIIAKNNYYN